MWLETKGGTSELMFCIRTMIYNLYLAEINHDRFV